MKIQELEDSVVPIKNNMRDANDNKVRFLELLNSVNREGVDKLCDYLEKTDFFDAPASA